MTIDRVFDPKIGWPVIIALLAQAGAGLLWAGAQAQRVSAVEARLEAQAPITERLARLEANMDQARASLTRIEQRLDDKERGR